MQLLSYGIYQAEKMLPLHPVERSNIRISIGSHFSNQTLLELACRQYSNSFLTWAYLLGLNRPPAQLVCALQRHPKSEKGRVEPDLPLSPEFAPVHPWSRSQVNSRYAYGYNPSAFQEYDIAGSSQIAPKPVQPGPAPTISAHKPLPETAVFFRERLIVRHVVRVQPASADRRS
ncbi:hypothetical protein F9K85_17415 [Brucella tritici]|uniref:hypothetical protein n=1 Tax=Brucella tritici TaxID=94626 RepID=UPI00124ED8C9|nr:hypothetical protein [Brucella tritici]KAB2674305.1 hypothetical protein F9K85_17415 [Brucella tritici]